MTDIILPSGLHYMYEKEKTFYDSTTNSDSRSYRRHHLLVLINLFNLFLKRTYSVRHFLLIHDILYMNLTKARSF